jgi:hypothetical protein
MGEVALDIQTPDKFDLDKAAPSLRVSFDVEKNTNRDPNVALVTISNLNPSNRALLQKGSDLVTELKKQKKLYQWQITIDGGYVGTKKRLFVGDITFADSRLEGPDWITTIEAGDEERNYNSRYVSKSFGPGTTLFSLLEFLAKELNVGLGDSTQKFAAPLRSLVAFKKGVAVQGKVSTLLDKYVSSAGYQWSIQDGVLQILQVGGTTLETIVELNESSGLIGSPEKGEDGTVTATSLLQGDLRPGRRVIIVSEMVNGTFKIERAVHFGDTWGPDWYTQIEAKPI